jgi:hypothetical protein
MPADILIPFKHLVPVRLKGRSGRERIAFGTATTPATVRVIDARDMETIRVRDGWGTAREEFAFEGRIWRPYTVRSANGSRTPIGIEEARALHSDWEGAGIPRLALPTIPDGLRATTGDWDTVASTRADIVADPALGIAAAARAVVLASKLVSDGTRAWTSGDAPNMEYGVGAGHVNWSETWTGSPHWRPTLPFGRPELAHWILGEVYGNVCNAREIDELAVKNAFLDAKAREDFPGMASDGSDIDAFLCKAAVKLPLLLPDLPQDVLSGADRNALHGLAALGSIGAVFPDDRADAAVLIARVAEAIHLNHPGRQKAKEAGTLMQHARVVVQARLAETPDDAHDIDAISKLAP